MTSTSHRTSAELPTAIPEEDLAAAGRRLEGVATRTPAVRVDAGTWASGCAKAENLQRTGSFKFRGAYNAMAAWRDEGVESVVTYSSGNHGAATAAAARALDMTAVVLMPEDAPAVKAAAVLRFGAQLVRYDRYSDDRHALAQKVADRTGARLLASSGHPEVLAGAATSVLELLDHAVPDVLFLPVGGGGLLAGAVGAIRARAAAVRLVAVEPVGCDAFAQSRAARARLDVPVGATIADGLQLSSVTELAWTSVREQRVDTVTVTEEQIRRAVSFAAEQLKLVVEPSGAVGLAAMLAATPETTDVSAATVLTGGNVGNARLASLLVGES